MQSILKQVYILAGLVFLLVFVLCVILYRGNVGEEKHEREVWLDLLRAVCCFTVVLLHCTCNVYKEFGDDLSSWYANMLMSAFTAFAVPCFYMISGASLLRRVQGVKETWKKRIPKLLIPLLFWSVIYIVYSGDVNPRRFVAMLFSGQWAHLWFMYCILSIYILLPMLSALYHQLNTKVKLYMLVILLFAPSLLHDLEYLLNDYVEMPHFAVFWPDLGLFFWGMFLWEQSERLARYGKLMPLGFAFGLAITAAFTVYTSFRDGLPNTNFISCIGSIGVSLMASSLFGFCAVYKDKLQGLSVQIKRCMAALGGISFGVYLIHPLVMDMFGYKYSNTGNILQMTLGAAMYFAVCVVICLCGKLMLGIRKCF